ncbi:MAG: hypothetical protein JWM27_2676 [Gemmatimonadetes bacterium]|nr:hypothetical protein [Gemmatimonadota bacterium]
MTPPQKAAPWADADTLSAVRPEVRSILEQSDGFHRLDPESQRRLAGTMVKVASYMANPDGLAKEELGTPGAGVLAQAQAQEDPVEATKRRLSQKQDVASKDYDAQAQKQGTKNLVEFIKEVDFPKFVSGLIQGVFQAIVDSSVQQMHAYGELLANVAKTVDEFAQDNISQNNARDWLSDKFPGKLGVDSEAMDGGMAADGEPITLVQPKLTALGDNPEAALKEISASLNLAKPVTDLSDEGEEQRLVQAARLQIARGRQQMLASMVMLGINRIVVTDGLINAKVVFDFKASDSVARTNRASMHDEKKDKSSYGASFSSWLSPVSASASSSSSHMTTVQSSLSDNSKSESETKAKLTGEVRVNFKSDYLPMDKMASPQMIAAISGNAVPADPKAAAGAPAKP